MILDLQDLISMNIIICNNINKYILNNKQYLHQKYEYKNSSKNLT